MQLLYGDIGVTSKTVGKTAESMALAAFYTRFVREGMTNAVRHGLATEMTVTCVSPRGGNQNCCYKQGLLNTLPGVFHLRHSWTIPKDAKNLSDSRIKSRKHVKAENT